MAVTRTASNARPRWWAAGMAWALWALGMLGVAAIWRLDHLLRQAGRSDFDRPYRSGASPLDLSGFGGPLLVIHQLAFGVANLAVVAGAVSLVVRFRRARGTERLQLRWVALAAAVVLLGSVVVLAALTWGPTRYCSAGWPASTWPSCRWRPARRSCGPHLQPGSGRGNPGSQPAYPSGSAPTSPRARS